MTKHAHFSRPIKMMAMPEINLFLFAFLLNFVYEVWQSPYYEFYGNPSLAGIVSDLTHCTFGDGVITLICSWIVSRVAWSRYWIVNPSQKQVALFTALGLLITVVIETYRVNVSRAYGVPVLAVPSLGMSSLALLQWLILPPIVLYLTRRHLLGYRCQN
jgi:hypothetical protein